MQNPTQQPVISKPHGRPFKGGLANVQRRKRPSIDTSTVWRQKLVLDAEEDINSEPDSEEFDKSLMQEAPSTETTYSARTTFRNTMKSDGSERGSFGLDGPLRRLGRMSFSDTGRDSFHTGRDSFQNNCCSVDETSPSFKSGGVVVATAVSILRNRVAIAGSTDHDNFRNSLGEIKEEYLPMGHVFMDRSTPRQSPKQKRLLMTLSKQPMPIPFAEEGDKAQFAPLKTKLFQLEDKTAPIVPHPPECDQASSGSASSSSSSQRKNFRRHRYSNGNLDTDAVLKVEDI